MNRLARSVTKWTQACDKRQARLISNIYHTNNCRQYCHVDSAAQHCTVGLFQDSDFSGDLEDSKSTSVGVLCIFGSRTFVPVRWMCKKQTSVAHSSTESEVISLDAGQRMDRLFVLDLWDIVIEVFRSTKVNIQPKQTDHQETGAVLDSKTKTQHVTRKQKVDQLSEVDYVPTNTHFSQGESTLNISEDNEAVIKMKIKGRSPTMRHLSRTHKVARGRSRWRPALRGTPPCVLHSHENPDDFRSGVWIPIHCFKPNGKRVCTRRRHRL